MSLRIWFGFIVFAIGIIALVANPNVYVFLVVFIILVLVFFGDAMLKKFFG